jgi:hypothetical protein
MRSRVAAGQRRLWPVGVIDTTDDTGAFRLFGLEPGDYYVVAMIRTPTPEDARMSAVTGPIRGDVQATVPVFFPGAPSLDQAQVVPLQLGAEARADIFLSPLRTARVSGVVLDSSGAPAADGTIELRSDMLNLGFSPAGPPPLAISAHAAPDGTFELPNVPPGSYTLIARVQNQRARGALDALLVAAADPAAVDLRTKAMQQMQLLTANMGEMFSMPLVIGNGDVSGLTLTTMLGGTLTATVVADAGVSRPLPRDVELQAAGPGTQGAIMNNTMTTNGVRTFRLAGMTGPTRLRLAGLPDDWAVKTITVDGTDVTDTPINIRGGNVDARIVLTDRVTEVNGTVPPRTGLAPGGASADTAPSAQYVVVFAADSSKWTYPSRFIRSTRTDVQGGFRITGLPGNERYLAMAIDYLEDGEAEDPQFLDRVRNAASPFLLNEGERKTIEVKPVQR